MPLKPKYVVFKIEDWLRYAAFEHADSAEGEAWRQLQPRQLIDAVVIRKQDTFAPNALYEYANQIRCAVELAEQLMGASVVASRPSIVTEMERLRELADDFFDEATDSEENHKRKVPD